MSERILYFYFINAWLLPKLPHKVRFTKFVQLDTPIYLSDQLHVILSFSSGLIQ
jgi:hypothetical protein